MPIGLDGRYKLLLRLGKILTNPLKITFCSMAENKTLRASNILFFLFPQKIQIKSRFNVTILWEALIFALGDLWEPEKSQLDTAGVSGDV